MYTQHSPSGSLWIAREIASKLATENILIKIKKIKHTINKRKFTVELHHCKIINDMICIYDLKKVRSTTHIYNDNEVSYHLDSFTVYPELVIIN